LISRVGDQIRELLSDLRGFESEYRANNMVRFTRAQAQMRGWEFPDEAFATPEDGGEQYIDLPGLPSAEERLMFAFPRAFGLARQEVKRLLALIVVPDEELRVAEGAGQIDEALDKLGDRLLHEGEIGEIVELLAAAVDHVRGQLAPHAEALGKLRGFLNRTSSPEETGEGADERKRTVEPMRVVSSSEPSSTDSPPPTDGPETTSSTALTGANS
jgi:hypothetical protein